MTVVVHTLDSITRLVPAHAEQVVVAASHGAVYAGYCAAAGRVRAVVLNDAGVGKDRAGIGALLWLEALGIAAATAGAGSCRIGDGADMMASGVISFVNAPAAALGCAPGRSVADCAERLRSALPSRQAVPPHAEARFVARDTPGLPKVVVTDSISLVGPDDVGAIVISASHGGLLGGDPKTAIKVDALAAVYSDAGFGKDRAGVSRLPALDARGIAAATVAADSARIGDGRSVYADGVVSCINRTAAAFGIVVGDGVAAFIDKVTRAAPR
jgi:hypothetical protein